MTSASPRFSSRFALLMSVLGIAVGTGNIWRFPRIVASNGGDEGAGAFLVAWLMCLLTWSIPLIIAEYAMGRTSRAGVVGGFMRVAGRRAAPLGAFVALVATGIMFYYAVVAGWCVYYLGQSLRAPLPQTTEAARQTWDHLQSSGWPVVLLALAIVVGGISVGRGVRSIEKVNRILVPTLLLIIVISTLRAVSLPGAERGMAYLFRPEWETLRRPQIWLEALTQNAWDTGAGWGLILTYAAYMRRQDFVVKNAVITGMGNNLVSLMAATMIFATVFATLGSQMSHAEILTIIKDSGPASTGLTFIWVPQFFQQMPGGRIFAALFFLGLSFAALSSLISMIELDVRVLVDFGFSRRWAVVGVCVTAFIIGLPSALNTDFLANQDFVWGLGLMISGLLISVALRRHGVARMRQELLETIPRDWRVGMKWDHAIIWLVPLQGIVLLGWWLYMSATSFAKDSWWNPFDTASVATCVLQWVLAAAFCVAMTSWMIRRFSAPPVAKD